MIQQFDSKKLAQNRKGILIQRVISIHVIFSASYYSKLQKNSWAQSQMKGYFFKVAICGTLLVGTV